MDHPCSLVETYPIKKTKMNQVFRLLLIVCFPTAGLLAQKIVRYELHIKDSLVNFTGVTKKAIAVNGQIPMPELHFTQGDTAEIHVYNEMDEPTSLHWHGLFLPNREDGVPYLTQMPIPPHSKYIYRFPIIQHGTHWYHSHSGMQEQIGMYGSLILHKRMNDATFRKGIDDLPAIPLILSEWTNMDPKNVHRMLHNATDWFAIRKGTTQSYAEAIKAGHLKTKLTNEWKRMLAMDVSDVYYDRFLINGKNESKLDSFKAGDKVRLRISNGGASTYFWLSYAGGKITVVASDGNDVEPVEVDRLMIAVSETYDIIVTIPDNKAYQLLATSEDRTGSAAIYLGNGPREVAGPLPRLKYFEGMKMMNNMMQLNGNLNDMGMKMSLNKMDMNSVMYDETNQNPDLVTLNYNMLRSPHSTKLQDNAPVKELHFKLTGNMNRYVWSMNNKVVSESDKILIRKGETVRMIIQNTSMMRHPMHLHGHDFRVLNDHGDYAPLKNVVDIMPMETDTLEFAANVEGDWFFHCHILYHMMSGMGRIFTYENQAANPLIPNPRLAQRKLFSDDRKLRLLARNDFASNGNDGMFMLHNTRWSLGTEWRLGYNKMHGYETETHFGRYLGKMQWIMPFIGFDWRYRSIEHSEEKNIFGQTNTKNSRTQLSVGLQYVLPMLFQFKTEIYTNGNVRLQLLREDIPVSKRLRASMMVNSDKEYMGSLRYIAGKNFGISAHYDSDMGFGMGLNVTY